MKQYITNDNDLTSIANAIRQKAGISDNGGGSLLTYPDEFIKGINRIETPTMEKSVALDMSDGDQVISPNDNKVLNKVTIEKPSTLIPSNIKLNIDIGGITGTLEARKTEQTKTVTYTANSSYSVTPDSGKVLSIVNVNVKVPTVSTQEKYIEITENGHTEVRPTEGYAFSSVTVHTDVPTTTLTETNEWVWNLSIKDLKLPITADFICGNTTYSTILLKDTAMYYDDELIIYGSVSDDGLFSASGDGDAGQGWGDYTARTIRFLQAPSDEIVKAIKSNAVKKELIATDPVNTFTITENGTHNITPDSVYGGFQEVNLNVNVPNYTPKELNPTGINFISWNGDIVETWTLDELQQATELPIVPPTIDLNEVTDISQIYFALPCWNTTLDDLKAANCPCNVGVCMDIETVAEYLSLYGEGNLYTVIDNCHAFALVSGTSFKLTSNARMMYTTDRNPTWGARRSSVTFSEEGTYWVSIRYDINAQSQSFTGNLIPADTDSGKVIAYILPMISKLTVEQSTQKYFPCSCLAGPMAQGCKSLRSFAYSPQSVWLGVANSFQGSYNLEHICIPPKTYTKFQSNYWDTFVLTNKDYYQQAFYVTDNTSLSSNGIGAYRLQSFMWPRGKKDVNTEHMPALYFNMLGNLRSFSISFLQLSTSYSGIIFLNDTTNRVMAEPFTIYISSTVSNDLVNYPFPESSSKLFPDRTDGVTFDQFNIYVDTVSLDAYKTADGWKDYADYIQSI